MSTLDDIQENIIKDARSVQERFMKEYSEKHKYCPACGRSSCAQTLTANVFNPDDPDAYTDDNDAQCKCGYKHTVHDRIGYFDLKGTPIRVGDTIRFAIFTTLMMERGDIPRDFIFEGVVDENFMVDITNFQYLPLKLTGIVSWNNNIDTFYTTNNVVKCLEIIPNAGLKTYLNRYFDGVMTLSHKVIMTDDPKENAKRIKEIEEGKDFYKWE